MFSRYWYFVLAAVAAAALAAAYLVNAATLRTSSEATTEALDRDRFEVELWMSLDDYARITAIAPMTTNSEVKNTLVEANARAAGTSLQAGSRQRLETTLTQLNQQLDEGRADVLVALDRNGVIVAQVGGSVPNIDASLRDLDLVRSCLDGEPKSGIWMREGVPLRAAARPVVSNGSVIGVIVHAMAIDDDLASRLAEHVEGSSIGFFFGDRMVASASARGAGAATSKDALATLIAPARARPELRQLGHVPPGALGETAEAIVALFPGQPLEGQLGFVVARVRPVRSSPFAAIGSARSEDVAHLPWPLVIGLPLILALIGVALLIVEKDRPLTAFAADLRKVADGAAERLDSSKHAGSFRLVAEDVNVAIERAVQVAQAAQRKSQSLDSLLGAAPAAAAAAPSFTRPSESARPAPIEAKPAAKLAPPPAPSAPAIPRASEVSKPAAIPAAPPAMPAAPFAAQAPAVPRASAASQAISLPPGPEDFEDDDESATTVAQIPAELLSTLHSDHEEEQQHFREVFDEYVRVRAQCNESTKGLTFEKFAVTLRKTKEQIVQRHGGSRVRFTVYVKEGKAALKASPR